MPERILKNVPYRSQLTNPFTDKYFASTKESSDRDRSPDGCWMNPNENNPYGFGKESIGCISPEDRFCIRSGSCNVTSLFMLLSYFGFSQKLSQFPDGRQISGWLALSEFSPSWIYYYMMEAWGDGQQRSSPSSEGNYNLGNNSVITADPIYMKKFVELLMQEQPGVIEQVLVKTESVTFSEYRETIESGSPVVIDIGRAGHVVLGIGYCDDDSEMAIVHDPYGRLNPKWLTKEGGKKWESYNRCGEEKEEPNGYGNQGESVEYPFVGLEPIYLLYCRPAMGFNAEFGGSLLNSASDIVAGIAGPDPRAEANRFKREQLKKGGPIEQLIVEHRIIPSEFTLDNEQTARIEFVAQKSIQSGVWQIINDQEDSVRVIMDSTITEGQHFYEWNGYENLDQNKVPAGKYRSQIETDDGKKFYSPYCQVKDLSG